MPGDIRDLDQVRPALHRTRHEASAEAVAAKGRGIEAQTGSTLLHDRRNVPRRKAPIRDPLGALVEDGAFDDAGGVQPRPESCDGARYLASGNGNPPTKPLLVRLRSA